MSSPSRVLLTGATGFVGRHLYPALERTDLLVRCASRDPEEARRELGDRDWVGLDLESGRGLRAALESCDFAYYLAHSMGRGGDYEQREEQAATRFAQAAGEAGLRRIVYLGGVAPDGEPSRHLSSRLRTGEILRNGPVRTIELRAAMIVGAGSISWQIVHDLAARLPAMALPAWLEKRSCPVFVDDLVLALAGSLSLTLEQSVWLDAPGPNVVRHKDLLLAIAHELGHDPPMVDVPFDVPELSSLWVGLFSDTDLAVAHELVQGLRSDLLPSGELIWDRLDGVGLTPLHEAIRLALLDGATDAVPAPTAIARILERSPS